MNSLRILFCAVILLFSFSCKKEQVISGILFPIEAVNGKLYLPNTFLKGEFEQIENQVSKEGLDEMEFLANSFSINLKKELFYDSKKNSNFIFMHSAPFTPSDKEVADLYYSLLEKRLSNNKKEFGRDYKFLEKRLYSNKGKVIIKVKILIKTKYVEKYQTQYIITKDRKTLGVVVSSLMDVDYEEYINTIQFK